MLSSQMLPEDEPGNSGKGGGAVASRPMVDSNTSKRDATPDFEWSPLADLYLEKLRLQRSGAAPGVATAPAPASARAAHDTQDSHDAFASRIASELYSVQNTLLPPRRELALRGSQKFPLHDSTPAAASSRSRASNNPSDTDAWRLVEATAAAARHRGLPSTASSHPRLRPRVAGEEGVHPEDGGAATAIASPSRRSTGTESRQNRSSGEPPSTNSADRYDAQGPDWLEDVGLVVAQTGPSSVSARIPADGDAVTGASNPRGLLGVRQIPPPVVPLNLWPAEEEGMMDSSFGSTGAAQLKPPSQPESASQTLLMSPRAAHGAAEAPAHALPCSRSAASSPVSPPPPSQSAPASGISGPSCAAFQFDGSPSSGSPTSAPASPALAAAAAAAAMAAMAAASAATTPASPSLGCPSLAASFSAYPASKSGSLELEAGLSAERWVASYTAPPLTGNLLGLLAYPGRPALDLGETVAGLHLPMELGVEQQIKLAEAIATGETIRSAWQTYQAFQKQRLPHEGGGQCLSWGGGVLRDFVSGACQRLNFAPPDEWQLYQVYTKFDVGRRMVLPATDCLCIVDLICRAMVGGRALVGSSEGTGPTYVSGRSTGSATPSNGIGCTAASIARGGASEAPVATLMAERWLVTYTPIPPQAAARITYPGDISVDFAEVSPWLAPVSVLNSALTCRMVQAVESGELLRAALQTFRSVDRNGRGSLSWAGGEVHSFIVGVLASFGILSPPSESQMYPLLKRFGAGSSAALEATQCICLVDAVSRAAFCYGDGLNPAPPLTAAPPPPELPPEFVPLAPRVRGNVYAHGDAFVTSGTNANTAMTPRQPQDEPGQGALLRSFHPTSLAEKWVANYNALPMSGTVSITYSSGVVVDFAEYKQHFMTAALANSKHRTGIIQAIETGDVMRMGLSIYQETDSRGYLAWENGEIWNYVVAVFQHYGLAPPSQEQVLPIYEKFDNGRKAMLNTSECLCLVDAVFRAVFFWNVDKLQLDETSVSSLSGQAVAQDDIHEAQTPSSAVTGGFQVNEGDNHSASGSDASPKRSYATSIPAILESACEHQQSEDAHPQLDDSSVKSVPPAHMLSAMSESGPNGVGARALKADARTENRILQLEAVAQQLRAAHAALQQDCADHRKLIEAKIFEFQATGQRLRAAQRDLCGHGAPWPPAAGSMEAQAAEFDGAAKKIISLQESLGSGVNSSTWKESAVEDGITSRESNVEQCRKILEQAQALRFASSSTAADGYPDSPELNTVHAYSVAKEGAQGHHVELQQLPPVADMPTDENKSISSNTSTSMATLMAEKAELEARIAALQAQAHDHTEDRVSLKRPSEPMLHRIASTVDDNVPGAFAVSVANSGSGLLRWYNSDVDSSLPTKDSALESTASKEVLEMSSESNASLVVGKQATMAERAAAEVAAIERAAAAVAAGPNVNSSVAQGIGSNPVNFENISSRIGAEAIRPELQHQDEVANLPTQEEVYKPVIEPFDHTIPFTGEQAIGTVSTITSDDRGADSSAWDTVSASAHPQPNDQLDRLGTVINHNTEQMQATNEVALRKFASIRTGHFEGGVLREHLLHEAAALEKGTAIQFSDAEAAETSNACIAANPLDRLGTVAGRGGEHAKNEIALRKHATIRSGNPESIVLFRSSSNEIQSPQSVSGNVVSSQINASALGSTAETGTPPVASNPLDQLGTVVGRGHEQELAKNETALRKHASIRASRINPDDLRGLTAQAAFNHIDGINSTAPGSGHVKPLEEEQVVTAQMDGDPLDRLGTVVGHSPQRDLAMNELALKRHASMRASRINPEDLIGLSVQDILDHDDKKNGVPLDQHGGAAAPPHSTTAAARLSVSADFRRTSLLISPPTHEMLEAAVARKSITTRKSLLVTQLTDIDDNEDNASTSSMASTIVPENMEGDASAANDDKEGGVRAPPSPASTVSPCASPTGPAAHRSLRTQNGEGGGAVPAVYVGGGGAGDMGAAKRLFFGGAPNRRHSTTSNASTLDAGDGDGDGDGSSLVGDAFLHQKSDSHGGAFAPQVSEWWDGNE